jgi:tRNA(Arg) A34 adenosine deaminase TadA
MSQNGKDPHEEFMRAALRLAREKMEAGCGGPFGAVIVKDGRIVAEGYNAVTSLNDPTAHAEVQAIRAACAKLGSFQLEDCDVYTSCEPCPMCLGALYWARPRKIYFASRREDAAAAGFDDEFIYQELAKPLDKRGLAMEQVLETEGKKAFEAWKAKADKVLY